VFPPSHHSAETVAWYKVGEPSRIDRATLRIAVAHLAAAAILVRHWPTPGSRQDAALALAGGLRRLGWTVEQIAVFIRAVANAAGDEETAKRATAAEFTERRRADGGTSTGWPTLAALIGEDAVACVTKWLERQLPPKHDREARREGGSEHKAPTQAQSLVSIAKSGGQFFHTPEGDAYASVRVNGHTENWPVRSEGFKDWLIHSFYDQCSRPPGSRRSVSSAEPSKRSLEASPAKKRAGSTIATTLRARQRDC